MNNIEENCDTNEFIEIDYSDESALKSKTTVVSFEVPDDVDVDVEGSDNVPDDTDAEGSDNVPDDTDVESSDNVPDDTEVEDSDYVPDDTDVEGFDKSDEMIESHKKGRTQSVSKTNQRNTKIKEISCKVCFKKFKYLKRLKQHLVSHSDKKCRKCDKCPNEIFLTLSELNEHKRTCHKIFKVRGRPKLPKFNYTCNVCSKHLKTRFLLQQHLIVHIGDTPFKCNYCGKVFARKSDRTRHIKTVCNIELGRKSKKFPCKTCKKTYSRLDKLKRHLLIHTGDMPYKCKLCKSTFNRSEALRKHEKDLVATGKCLPLNHRFSRYKKSANKYKCHDCGSYYSKLQYLKIHMRIHTGVKPFQCGTCSKAFIRIDSLRRHVKEKHN